MSICSIMVQLSKIKRRMLLDHIPSPSKKKSLQWAQHPEIAQAWPRKAKSCLPVKGDFIYKDELLWCVVKPDIVCVSILFIFVVLYCCFGDLASLIQSASVSITMQYLPFSLYSPFLCRACHAADKSTLTPLSSSNASRSSSK